MSINTKLNVENNAHKGCSHCNIFMYFLTLIQGISCL